MTSKIRVLVVDDSALVRQVLTEILGTDPRFEVVGTAQDPYIAREKIKQLDPDVLTLDVEMPRMDGVTFLRNLMRLRPIPVVMISSLTEQGADITLQALELGAVDFVAKPRLGVADGLAEYAATIKDKVATAAGVDVRSHADRLARGTGPATTARVAPRHSADVVLAPLPATRHYRNGEPIIAIGASTGGTEAIREILQTMPAEAPALVITQHIPAAFSAPFAARMDRASALTVSEAVDGEPILPGHAYIAPGDRHLLVRIQGQHRICQLDDGLPVNRHKPSVDVLFRSVAQTVGPLALGVLLTGMGNDGAMGLLEMKQAGAPTLIQDRQTAVVWGMPGAAARLGAADEELPLGGIAARLMCLAGGARSCK